MSQRRKPPRSNLRDNPENTAANSIKIVAVVMGGLIYLCLFYGSSLPSLARLGEGQFEIRRGPYLVQSMLLMDEVAAGWFGDPPQFEVLDRLPILVVATMLVASGGALGWLVLTGAGMTGRLNRLETLVFSAGVGLNLQSLWVLGLGLAGQIQNRWWLVVGGLLLLAATMYLAWKRSNRWLGPDQSRFRSAQPRARERVPSAAVAFSGRWLWAVLPFGLAILGGGLLPPIEFDAREYHLQAPKEFFQAGRISFLPHNVYANMPLGVEMHTLLGMWLLDDWWQGGLVGKTVTAVYAPLTALVLFVAGRRLVSISAGVMAAVTYLSTPWIARVSNFGLIEGAYGFYLILAVYALLMRDTERSVPSAHDANPPGGGKDLPSGETGSALALVGLAGLCAGGAAACKYPAVVFVVLPLFMWVAMTERASRGKALGVFALCVGVSSGLWFAKNAVATGNPFYPLLFGGTSRTDALMAQWTLAHRPSVYSVTSVASSLVQVLWRSEWLSPWVMPAAALAWLASPKYRRQTILLWGYFGLVIVGWWLFTHRIDRFWIPALPVLCLLAGIGVHWTENGSWFKLCHWFLTAGLICNFVFVVGPTGGYNRYFVSYRQLRASPDRVDPWHRTLNQTVPAGHRVLLVGDAQVFDLEVPVLYNTVFDTCVFETLFRGRSADEIRDELDQQKISHVFVHWGEIGRYRSPGNYGFTDFVQPDVFRALVEQKVLERVEPDPPIEAHAGELYRVSDGSD